MASQVAFRIAAAADLPTLATLRWRLKEGDDATPGEAFERFADAFTRFERDARAQDEVFHWLAEVDGAPAAAMSVVSVRKTVSPDGATRRWGYLTNCYVTPEHRSRGLGGRMLEAIKSWATENALEFVIVWPSDRAFPFYERSGFRPPDDLLVWSPER